jgi:hypothetical protein
MGSVMVSTPRNVMGAAGAQSWRLKQNIHQAPEKHDGDANGRLTSMR